MIILSLGDAIETEPNFKKKLYSYRILIRFLILIIGIQINHHDIIDFIVSGFNQKLLKEIEKD